jgi:hypothetical protein
MNNTVEQNFHSPGVQPAAPGKVKSKSNQRIGRLRLFSIVLPGILLALFHVLKDDLDLMQTVMANFSAPLRSFLAEITSVVPLPVGELLFLCFAVFSTLYIIRGLLLFFKNPSARPLHVKRILTVLSVALWIGAGFSWLWSIGYYVPGFAQANRLGRSDLSTEDLEITTKYFADIVNLYADRVVRDENNLFAEDADEYFEGSLFIYDNLEKTFPGLSSKTYPPKRLIFSRLQSFMGFTGFYCPYTGEANINTDFPACLQPVTIAHEMAHQRWVSAEDEANFVAIAACLSSEDPVYIYSGALMGLMKLGAALNSQAPEAWLSVSRTLKEGVAADWNNNADYWAQFESPLEKVSQDAYDSFLKANDQELGIRSYGACVDLLVAYYPSFQ